MLLTEMSLSLKSKVHTAVSGTSMQLCKLRLLSLKLPHLDADTGWQPEICLSASSVTLELSRVRSSR
jgi:hypothetical protein